MMYEILEDFKDGYDCYFKGEVRKIDPNKAAAFAHLGWVKIEGVEANREPQQITLEINNLRTSQSTEVK